VTTRLIIYFYTKRKMSIAVARLYVVQPTYAHAHNMHLIYRVTSTAEDFMITSIKRESITINTLVV
jgi:hypothetical protein